MDGDDRGSVVRYMSKVVAYTAKHQSGDRGALSEQVAAFYERLDKHAQNLVCNRRGCAGKRVCDGRCTQDARLRGADVDEEQGMVVRGIDVRRVAGTAVTVRGHGFEHGATGRVGRGGTVGTHRIRSGVRGHGGVGGGRGSRSVAANAEARQTATRSRT